MYFLLISRRMQQWLLLQIEIPNYSLLCMVYICGENGVNVCKMKRIIFNHGRGGTCDSLKKQQLLLKIPYKCNNKNVVLFLNNGNT